MIKQLLTLSAVALSSLTASSALAQYYLPPEFYAGRDITQQYNQWAEQFNAQMNQQTQQIIQQNMNDPYVQQRYQEYLQQGGTLNFADYAYRYAETGGFSQEGFRNAMQSQQRIAQQDRAAAQQYYDYSYQLRADTNAYRDQVNANIQRYRGENLTGNGNYVGPDGAGYQLPYTSPPGTVHYDRGSGNYFTPDAMGNYWMGSGDGWWQMMYRQ